jgi:hypothetical protein
VEGMDRIGACRGNLLKKYHLEDLCVDGRILERIFNKQTTSYRPKGPEIESH